MISTKIGTQPFSKSPQRHDFGDEANMRYAPATPEPEKVDKNMKQGAKNVGEQLNDIANPGGDSNKTKRKSHNTLDKDDFLKLMLTQMKNQDPMSPLQSHEMAAQLAQFTSLEQLFNVNKNLEGLARAQDPVQKYEALNFLGKSIKADTRQIVRQAGDQGTDLRFNLMADAQKIKLTIQDEEGKTIKTVDFGNLKAGANKVAWNGTDNEGRDVKSGKFMFNIEAENGGKKIGVVTETKGTITGINYTPEGPMLMVGDQRVRLQDVQKIEDEGLREKQSALEGPGAIAKPAEGADQVPPEVLAQASLQASNNGLATNGAMTAKIPMKPETKEASRELGAGATMSLDVASNGQVDAQRRFKKP
jgi:flagellar basal-body rod modification protein FlgD